MSWSRTDVNLHMIVEVLIFFSVTSVQSGVTVTSILNLWVTISSSEVNIYIKSSSKLNTNIKVISISWLRNAQTKCLQCPFWIFLMSLSYFNISVLFVFILFSTKSILLWLPVSKWWWDVPCVWTIKLSLVRRCHSALYRKLYFYTHDTLSKWSRILL